MAHSASNTYLVTGALGCIGAWTVYHLLQEGARVVSLDVATDTHRLDLLLTAEEQAAITKIRGDLSDPCQVLGAFKAHAVTHVIHLAALQVPSCKANPAHGAQVNVVGTINVFEAARQTGIRHMAVASSIAIYGPSADYPPGLVPHTALPAPRTLYGVYKLASEGIARIYWQDYGISSVTLRPHAVYGLGRDQGLTSDPTQAMLAAAAGLPYRIRFGGPLQMQWVSDVARQFIQAARVHLEGAHGFNLGGDIVDVPQVIGLIRQVKPSARISHTGPALPSPGGFDDRQLQRYCAPVYHTPLADGIRHTIEQFEARLADGRLSSPGS